MKLKRRHKIDFKGSSLAMYVAEGFADYYTVLLNKSDTAEQSANMDLK